MSPRKAHIDLGPGLSPRERAMDALYRVIESLDRHDEELMRSAMTKDAIFDLSALSVVTGQEYPEQKGIEEIVNGVLAHVGPMVSSHHLSNVRVKLNDSADGAEVTCYALAQHFRKGEGHDPQKRDYVLFGNTYWADVVRDGSNEEALWKIRRFEIYNLWAEGEPAALHS